MLLGDLLRAEADAALHPEADAIVRAFEVKALLHLSQGRFHVTYITKPLVHDRFAGSALAEAVKLQLNAQRILDCQFHVGTYEWKYTIDPGWESYCSNEEATHGFVIRLDYWAKQERPANLPTIEGKLLTPSGHQDHVRAGSKGVNSLWSDADGDLEEADRLRRQYEALPILGEVSFPVRNDSTLIFLGDRLNARADAVMHPLADNVLRNFLAKCPHCLAQNRCVTHVSQVVAQDMASGAAIAGAVIAKLAQHNVHPMHCHVAAYEWKYTIDPGLEHYCLNEDASHGFVIRIDYWPMCARPPQVSEIRMKLRDPNGHEQDVRADPRMVVSLWSDPELDGSSDGCLDFYDDGGDDFDDAGLVYDDGPEDFDDHHAYYDEYD